jgi:hypothetical protein
MKILINKIQIITKLLKNMRNLQLKLVSYLILKYNNFKSYIIN